MLTALRHFLAAKEITRSEVSGTLRLVFVAMFFAQIVLALLLGFGLRLTFNSAPSSPLLAQILLTFSVVQLPLTLFLSQQAGRSGGRQAALSAALLSGVLLATPAWFLSLVLALGTQTLYLVLFFAVLMSYYLIGLLLVRGFSHVALQPERNAKTRPNKIETQS